MNHQNNVLALVSGTNSLPKGSPQTKLQEIDFSGVAAEICGLPKPQGFDTLG